MFVVYVGWVSGVPVSYDVGREGCWGRAGSRQAWIANLNSGNTKAAEDGKGGQGREVGQWGGFDKHRLQLPT